MKQYFVYILASRRDGVLYVGVTSDLIGRVLQHKFDRNEGFTKKYRVHALVWFEEFGDINDAIEREKRIKKWNRAWKIALIEKNNLDWSDLFWPMVGPQAAAEIKRRLGPLTRA
jgi:putative endonuclease